MKHANINEKHIVLITNKENFDYVSKLNKNMLNKPYEFYSKNIDLYIRLDNGRFGSLANAKDYELMSIQKLKNIVNNITEPKLILW